MQVSNRVVIHSILWVVTVCIIVAVYGFSDRYFEQKRTADGIVEVKQLQQGEASSQDFIGVCSGMDISNPEVHLVAMSECMGRVRGFVDGHNLTVAMNQLAGVKSVNLWCMPPRVTTGQLITAVMDWVDANPEGYDDIRLNMDVTNSATAVMIRALRVTYPCVNS